jgi:hypothetical protein
VNGSDALRRLPEVPLEDADDDGGEDDDAPLEAAEAALGAATADEEADESLDERVEAVVEDLEGVTRERVDDSVTYATAGRVFAVLTQERLEVALDPAIATAALRTPDAVASSRGQGWIAFAPGGIDRFALDRADAWLRLAHRRANGG